MAKTAGITDPKLETSIIRSMDEPQRLALAAQWDQIKDLKLSGKEQIAVSNELVQQFQHLTDLARRTDSQRVNIHKMLVEAMDAAAGTKMGPARADKILKNLSRFDSNTIYKVRESLESLTPMARAEFGRLMDVEICVNPCIPVTKFIEESPNALKELRAAGMVSGLGTFARNTVGTQIRNALNPARSLFAAGFDVVATPITRAVQKARGVPVEKLAQRDRFVGEAVAELWGFFDAVKGMAKRRSVQVGELPGDLIEFGTKTRAIREAVRAPSAFAGKGPVGNAVSKFTQTVFKTLDAQDTFMFQQAYSGELYRWAYRKALQEGKTGMGAFGRVKQILKEETSRLFEAHKAANAFATAQGAINKATPTETERLAVQAWKQFAREQNPDVTRARELAERAVFIAREGKRLDKETLRASPAGFVSPLIPENVGGKFLPAFLRQSKGESMDQLGMAAAGTAIMYSALKMAESGMIQIEPFGQEKSRAQRLTKESAGIGQDNVVLNGWSIPADRLEPIGPLFLAVGRAKELADAGEIEGAAQFAEATAWDVVNRMKDNTFLDSIARFTEAMTADDKRAARFFNQLGASFVPSIVRDVRQAAFGTGITEVTPPDAPFGPRGIIAEPIRGFAGRFGADDPKLGAFGEARKRGALGVRTGGDPIAQELVNRGVYIDIPKASD
jgi:hypothetical protein